MTTLRHNVIVRRRVRLFRRDTFCVLVIDIATAYDFPTQQEAADFIAKHLPGNVTEWRTA